MLNDLAKIHRFFVCKSSSLTSIILFQFMCQGYTALIHAAGENLEDIVELLIEFKADLNIQDKDGWSALMYASSRGNEDVAKTLVDAGARLDLRNIHGKDAVTLAHDESYTEIESYIRSKMSCNS